MKEMITVEEFVAFCVGSRKIFLSERDKERVRKGRLDFETACASESVYGANTGVGPFLDVGSVFFPGYNRIPSPSYQESRYGRG